MKSRKVKINWKPSKDLLNKTPSINYKPISKIILNEANLNKINAELNELSMTTVEWYVER